jgi:hypothetical protein
VAHAALVRPVPQKMKNVKVASGAKSELVGIYEPLQSCKMIY